jgi:hypothetical protein
LLDPEARRQIADSPSDTSCTFLIQWHEEPSESMFEGQRTKRERLETLVRFFREAKAPIREQLEGAGFIIQDLATSSQMIATAPASKWQEILPQLEHNREVAVLPNRMFRAI